MTDLSQWVFLYLYLVKAPELSSNDGMARTNLAHYEVLEPQLVLNPSLIKTVSNSHSVQVWVFQIMAFREIFDQMQKTLSDDEITRFSEMGSEERRMEFGVTRAAARIVLGRHLTRDPHQIKFTYDTTGKPHVADAALSVSLSHSHGLGAVALAEPGRLGVDIEKVRQLENEENLRRRIFNERELEILESNGDAQLFFRFWTAKEAFFKAYGTEGFKSFRQLSVGVDDEGIVEFLSYVSDGGVIERLVHWKAEEFVPAQGYSGTVAFSPAH